MDDTAATADPLLTAAQAAIEVGISAPAFWKAVAAGRLPQPFYPAPRAPRWRRGEIAAALEKTRATPRDQRESRKQEALAKLQAV